jgi:hypothetical protein
MKTAFTALLVFFSISMAAGQAMCKSIRFIDQTFIPDFDYPYHTFKKYDNAAIVPDSAKQRIAEATVKETSRSFFKKLIVKKVFVFDSTIKKRSFDGARFKDDTGNEIDLVYSFLYEVKLNENIPFLFRVDYNRSGDIMRKTQLTSLNCKRLKVINCDKAIEAALTDKTEPIHHGIDESFLVVNPIQKTVVYQITSVMDPETNMVYIKLINAYNGKVIARNNYKVEIENFDGTRVGG